MALIKSLLFSSATGGGTKKMSDPAGIGGKLSKPKKPAKTAGQLAAERRTTSMLDEEIAKQEELLKAMARNRLGSKSLLTGASRTRAESAGRAAKVGGGSASGSLLPSGIGGGSGASRPAANRNIRRV